jgi:hypothetical protein
MLEQAFDDIEGEYLVIYTRPLDRACDQKSLSATFPPNFREITSLLLQTDRPETPS